MNQDPEDIPVRGLVDLEQPVSSAFVTMVRRKIHRRTAASQFAGFSYNLPKMILLEFINLIIHIFAVADGRKDQRQ